MKYFLIIFLFSSISNAGFNFGDCIKIERDSFYQKYCGKYAIIRINKRITNTSQVSESYFTYQGQSLDSNKECSFNFNIEYNFKKFERVLCPSDGGMPYEVLPKKKKLIGLPHEM